MGGGIAMQFAYQFPERVERLALVSSGGLGREVGWGARGDAPRRRPRAPGHHPARPRDAIGARKRADGPARAAAPRRRAGRARLASLSDPRARRAFLHTARSIIDGAGQRVSATDRLYLAEGMPTLIVWGERDPMIPAAHGVAAHALIPHSRLELFPDAGHYPFDEDPERFVEVLRDFIADSPAAVYDEETVRRRLREGAPA